MRRTGGVQNRKEDPTPSIIPSENVDQYLHSSEKRTNNPPVGLVTPDTDRDMPKKRYLYDPHLEPQLQWTGKAEYSSFAVDTVSLHVHERIDPGTVIEKLLEKEKGLIQASLFHYFEKSEQNPPLREAIQFYKHDQNWSNRLIAGDSLLVMNSLLQKEGMAGKVQMIYMDPPYGIRYGSNFQPFINKREVKDGRDEDLTQEPEMVSAFRDTWELGIHSYLSYLSNRLLLARDLLTESGSIFLQISEENVHLVRCLLDEIFGRQNYVSMILFSTTGGFPTKALSRIGDYLIWYAKDIQKLKFRPLYKEKLAGEKGASKYDYVELANGTRRRLTRKEQKDPTLLPPNSRIYRTHDLRSQGQTSTGSEPFFFKGKKYEPGPNMHWKTTIEGMKRLAEDNRIIVEGNLLSYVRYLDDFPVNPLNNDWDDTGGVQSRTDPKIYVVQTGATVVRRCVLMTSDPGDLILDPTCGSGTTAYVAEQWGRRWITCDTSRVAIALAKQRLMTAVYDYYELKHPSEGVSSGFNYKTVPHITLKSIANNEPPNEEDLYDQPFVDKQRTRISGPFTVEAVPSPVVKPLDTNREKIFVDNSVAREGAGQRHAQWLQEIVTTGIREKGGNKMTFSRLEVIAGTRWIHATGETSTSSKRVALSFGPEFAPLEQRQVALAISEALSLVPKPEILLFAAFQFDPEAAKDIDETNWPGIQILKVQMNTDLFTEDLKKKRTNNESFWLIGQPDIVIEKENDKYVVKVRGFDYYDTKTGDLRSENESHIAMWMLDTDYDERSLYPRQIFFPMAGASEGWGKIGRTLRAQIDADLLEAYRGTESLPFELGQNKQVAVKIIDDRGIESLRILKIKD